MESGSPWSTPTQSEIGEAESQLKYLSDIDLKLGVEHKLMVRELGDGEPSENSVTEIEDRPVRNESLKSSKTMSLEDKEGGGKRRSRNKSKSPIPPNATPGAAKPRKASLSPTKGKLMDQTSNGEKMKAGKGAKGRLQKQQSLPQDINTTGDEQNSKPKPRGRLRRQESEQNYNGSSTGGFDTSGNSSAATTTRTHSTTHTDGTSSNSSGTMMPQSPTKSPTRSPTKKGAKARARDVLQLPKPYCYIKSDTIKRWNGHYEQGKSLEGDEKDLNMFKQVDFTHALILKVNQLSKQGLLDRKTCFKFACNVARYVVPDPDVTKCMTSFYSYARELSNMREGIKTPEQKNMFDLEQSGWIPPTFPRPYVQQNIIARPQTSKPKDPDAYDFKDEQLAKDYRKMWDKYHQMEALLKQKKANDDGESD